MHYFTQGQRAMREHLCLHMAIVCEHEKFKKRASYRLQDDTNKIFGREI